MYIICVVMEPIRKKSTMCVTTSSNSVIWQGRDLPCINLCNGDTISDVVYKVAEKLCELMDQFDISNYDIENLMEGKCGPKDFHEIIQMLIDNYGTSSSSGSSSDSSDEKIEMADCFCWDNEEGDKVTKMSKTSYLKRIGAEVCQQASRLTVLGKRMTSAESRIEEIEQSETSSYEEPVMSSQFLNKESVNESDIVAALDAYNAVIKPLLGTLNISQIESFSQKKVLADTSKTYGNLDKWISNAASVTNYLSNMSLVISDVHDMLLKYINSNPLTPSVKIINSFIDGSGTSNKLVINFISNSIHNIEGFAVKLYLSKDTSFTSYDSIDIVDEDVLSSPFVITNESLDIIDLDSLTGNIYIKTELSGDNIVTSSSISVVDVTSRLFGTITLNEETDYDKIVLNVTDMPQSGTLILYNSEKKQIDSLSVEPSTGTYQYTFDDLTLGYYYYRMQVGDNYTEYIKVSTKTYIGESLLVKGGYVTPVSQVSIPASDIETYLESLN